MDDEDIVLSVGGILFVAGICVYGLFLRWKSTQESSSALYALPLTLASRAS